jgi:hypothetical protein
MGNQSHNQRNNKQSAEGDLPENNDRQEDINKKEAQGGINEGRNPSVEGGPPITG